MTRHNKSVICACIHEHLQAKGFLMEGTSLFIDDFDDETATVTLSLNLPMDHADTLDSDIRVRIPLGDLWHPATFQEAVVKEAGDRGRAYFSGKGA